MLQPVTWTEDAETGLPETVDVSGKDWTLPTVIPTKGADDLAGKPALAYAGYEEAEDGTKTATGTAYLYLGADSLQYTDLSDARVVTVRFKYLGGATADSVTMPGIPGTGAGEPEQPPTAEPEPTGGEADAANEAGGTEDTEGGESGTEAPKYTIDLAPLEVSREAIPGTPLLTTTGGGENGSLRTWYYGENYSAVSTDVPNPYSVTFEKGPGESANTGKDKGGSGDYAITFFDWDGRVIDAIAAPNDAEDAVREWQTNRADIKERLTNKLGYAFDKWLVVYEDNDGEGLHTKGGTFTSNDGYLSANNPDIADFSDLEKLIRPDPDAENKRVSNAVMVQAAYVAKSVANGFSEQDGLVNGGGTTSAEAFYTISEPVYTRYGAAGDGTGSYSLTMTVTRKNGDYGVTRLREPAIVVAMENATGKDILNLIRLENTDTTTFEVVTTKQITRVRCRVVDVYGKTNWPGCDDKSVISIKERNDCIAYGTQGYLAEQAYAVYTGGTWEGYVDNWAFADSFLNTSNNQKKVSTWWTETRCNAAKTALLQATQTKKGKLTMAEVLTALGGVS